MGSLSQGFGGIGVPGCTLKAWVHLSAAGVVIKSSGVASAARSSSGVYTVTFTTAMGSVDYVSRFTPSGSSGIDSAYGKMNNTSTTAVATLNTGITTGGGTSAVDIAGVWEFYA